MIESAQPGFTASELDRLQRLRASVLAFQNEIAALPADQHSNALNEQFNQLRLEAKAMLQDRSFDKKVAGAVTDDLLADHAQRTVLPRLSGIVILGVILALVGLGVNSIILEDAIVNSLGCCVSSAGMLLVIGAFGVWGVTNFRPKLTNFGDLYQRCDRLLYQINHALNMAIPNLADRPAVDVPPIPSVVELALDSLNTQAADWRQKLRALEEQRLTLGPDAPMELTINIDFAQRKLDRVRQEIDQLSGREALDVELVGAPDVPEEETGSPAAGQIARANTEEMPVAGTGYPPDSAAQDTPAEAENTDWP